MRGVDGARRTKVEGCDGSVRRRDAGLSDDDRAERFESGDVYGKDVGLDIIVSL
jgi:hypothetical protein